MCTRNGPKNTIDPAPTSSATGAPSKRDESISRLPNGSLSVRVVKQLLNEGDMGERQISVGTRNAIRDMETFKRLVSGGDDSQIVHVTEHPDTREDVLVAKKGAQTDSDGNVDTSARTKFLASVEAYYPRTFTETVRAKILNSESLSVGLMKEIRSCR